jgi:hypothetical protein
MRVVRVSCLAVLVASSTARAQTTLVKVDPSSRGGNVRVTSNGAGLSISGSVDGGGPRWPTTPADLPHGDRIEVSIADVAPVHLPPVGWGHQFGYEFLSREGDCLTREGDTTATGRRRCTEWFRQQTSHREKLGQLFARRWAIAPSIVEETFARPAFAALDENARAAVAPLAPNGLPTARFTTTAAGYAFEIAIPWSALPPLQSVRVNELRLVVDVRTGAARSTTSPNAALADPSTLPRVALSAPRTYDVTPCRADFVKPIVQSGPGRDFVNASDSARVYFMPSASLQLTRAIVVDAPAQGYQYEPDSTLVSPIASTMTFWVKSLGNGEVLCGPYLAYRRGERITRSGQVVDLPDSLTSRRLAAGDVLVKSGPRVMSSYFGSGQCGACPRVVLEMFHLSRATGAITQSFSYFGIAEPENTDMDVVVSPSWGEITIYEGKTDFDSQPSRMRWKATTYCFRAAKKVYEECRHASNVRPPSPRRIDPSKSF